MKKVLSLFLKLFISSFLLYIFYTRVDLHSVIKIIKEVKIPLFTTGLFVYLCTILVSTKRWSLFLPQTIKYSKLISLYLIGAFFNTFLPGLVGGDAVKAYYLYRHIGKGGTSLASVFMDRYMGLTAMAVIGFVAFIAGYTYIQGSKIIWFIPIFCTGFLVASFILWKVNWGKIRFLSSFYMPLMGYKKRKEIIYKGLLLGFIVQCISITSVYILSLSISLQVPIISFFVFIPIITAASATPVTVAGLGIREAGFVILFAKVGLTSEEALTLSLLMFTTMCLVNLVGGIEYLRARIPYHKES